jgi:hypothetical protein
VMPIVVVKPVKHRESGALWDVNDGDTRHDNGREGDELGRLL